MDRRRIMRASEQFLGLHQPEEIWIGPDLVVAKDTILGPGKNVVHLIYPPHSKGKSFSLRSRLAQLSCHPLGSPVYTHKNRGTLEIQVLGPRFIEIPAGEGLGCCYDLIGTDQLTTRELYERVFERNDGVRIDGVYGEDWFFYDDSSLILNTPAGKEKMQQNAIGIALKLIDTRWRIKRSKEHIVLTNQPNYRDFLDDYIFEEVPPDEYEPFWVSETRARVILEDGYNGVLENLPQSEESIYFQSHSTLIRGGKNKQGKYNTGWRIRTEFKDLGISHHLPRFVYLKLYRDKKLRPRGA